MTFFKNFFSGFQKFTDTPSASSSNSNVVDFDEHGMVNTYDFSTLNQTNIMTTPSITPAPSHDLFVDTTAPTSAPASKGYISTFLSQNYFRMGLTDGYQYHSDEILVLGKKKIKADFILCIDKAIEEKKTEKVRLQNSLHGLNSLVEVCSNLETRIEEVNDRIAEIQHQKHLSVDDEGWVMTAVYEYQKGFLQGLKDWMESENLLCISSNF